MSPLLIHGERLEIKRDFTFQSGAVQFLIKHSFDIGAVFTKGVPYLSREEESTARTNYSKKQEMAANIPDIVISPDDDEAVAFYTNARKTIFDFANQKKVCSRDNNTHWHEIIVLHLACATYTLHNLIALSSRSFGGILRPFLFVIPEGDERLFANTKQQELDFVNIGHPDGLNGLQRRLVHQLVRNEFPSCRTFGRGGGEFMQVEKLDPEKEALVSQF